MINSSKNKDKNSLKKQFKWISMKKFQIDKFWLDVKVY